MTLSAPPLNVYITEDSLHKLYGKPLKQKSRSVCNSCKTRSLSLHWSEGFYFVACNNRECSGSFVAFRAKGYNSGS
jgi:hypothetical protein